MSLLVVNASTACSKQVDDTISILSESAAECQVLDITSMHIEHCRGCYVCMLKTPGRCCICDDAPKLIRGWVQSDSVVLIVDTALGFVDSKGKKIIERLLLLASIMVCYRNGETLHVSRYAREPQIALLYTGYADVDLMNMWLARVANHCSAKSLGAMPLANASEVCRWVL